jgi:hypothetical protein
MVSSPNTEGLYGNAATGATQSGPYVDPYEKRNQDFAKTEWDNYQAAEKKKKEEAEAAAAAAKAAAAAGQVGYRDSLEAWKKSANDWTGGQTHFSNPYMIPILQARARQKAGAAPKPGAGASSGDWALYDQYVKAMSTPTTASGYQGYAGNSSGGGGHLR